MKSAKEDSCAWWAMQELWVLSLDRKPNDGLIFDGGNNCRVMAMFASGVLCDSAEAGAEASSSPMDTDADDHNLRAAFSDFLHSFAAGMEVPLSVYLTNFGAVPFLLPASLACQKSEARTAVVQIEFRNFWGNIQRGGCTNECQDLQIVNVSGRSTDGNAKVIHNHDQGSILQSSFCASDTSLDVVKLTMSPHFAGGHGNDSGRSRLQEGGHK